MEATFTAIGTNSVQSDYNCYSCHKKLEKQINTCSRCRLAIYCSRDCQLEDWKEKHKFICFDTTKPYTDENEGIRSQFSSYDKGFINHQIKNLKHSKNNHVLQTQKMILDGSKHLDPNKSIVIVCGAQFYKNNNENKFIEPLPQLLERCKKLILVDVDPVTLENLHKMLGSSTKVSTVVLDLTCSLKHLHTFYEEASQSTKREFRNKIFTFLKKVSEDTTNRAAGLAGILVGEESADYVISSLVASQLSIRLKEALFNLYQKKFVNHISEVISEIEEKTMWEHISEASHLFVMKHVEDLCAWAGTNGSVYFADSVNLFQNGQKLCLVTQETIKCLSDVLRKRKEIPNSLATRQWQWVANERYHYDINAWHV